MNRKRVFISGPMSGYANHNRPAFFEVAERLYRQGYEVVNPALLTGDTGKPWEWWMRRCIRLLAECDAIYQLEGWRNSRGARLEHINARELGLEVMP